MDAPDSLGAVGPVQAVSLAARDPAASGIEHGDELESAAIEAMPGAEGGGGIRGFVEPPVGEGEAAHAAPGP